MLLCVFSCAVLCLIYNFLVFRHLGRRRFRITLGLCLAGIAAVVGSSFFMEGVTLFLVSSCGLVVAVFMAGCLLNHVEDWKKLRRSDLLATLPARRLKSAEDIFSLSREDMLANFRELAAVDNLAVYAPEKQFLAWNDAQGLDIRIRLLPDEDWIGLLYLTDFELRDSEIKAACKKSGVDCPPDFLGVAPSGLVICRKGKLIITPAAQKEGFSELRRSVLASRAEFITMLRDYAEEG